MGNYVGKPKIYAFQKFKMSDGYILKQILIKTANMNINYFTIYNALSGRLAELKQQISQKMMLLL